LCMAARPLAAERRVVVRVPHLSGAGPNLEEYSVLIPPSAITRDATTSVSELYHTRGVLLFVWAAGSHAMQEVSPGVILLFDFCPETR
jgi:hypothetical protein